MKALDIRTVPLEGTVLIEASAGTGKTWSITGLFLRFLLEKRLGVDQILVVTFTNAATEELRIQVRNRLLKARQALAAGRSPDKDALLQFLVQRYFRDPGALEILSDALREFDRAAIFTIHGFCHRLLQEWAFETGAAFDTELVTDPLAFIQEVCDDFWRRRLYAAPPEFVGYCLERMKGPEALFSMLIEIRWPDIRVVPRVRNAPLSGLDPFRSLLNRVKRAWPKCREAVTACLTDASLNRHRYSQKRVFNLINYLDFLAGSEASGFPLPEDFVHLTPERLQAGTKKGKRTPTHPFFDLCKALQEAAHILKNEMEKAFVLLKTDFFRFAETELAARKRRFRLQFYEDLLLAVRNTLRSGSGRRLVHAVAKTYQAALVDEFQDTDPIQYEIFSRLFSRPGQALFMIGDPKQAIYGFRGADLFSYMKAARKARKSHTLTRNFRSVPKLVQAVNALFSHVSRPFLFEEIPFHAGSAAKKEDPTDGSDSPPFKIWYVPGRDGKPVGKTEAVAAISEAVADEIVSLVDGGQFQEKEIAVLVRTHRQARIVKQALTQRRMPAVLFSDEDVFRSREAVELERLLSGIQDPLNPFRVRAALATDLAGFTAGELDPESTGNKTLEAALARFQEYHTLWRKQGFIPMFARFMEQERVKARLIRYPDGERRLTNLMHLAELLQEASASHPFTMTGLLKWFSIRRSPHAPGVEAHQLRLESDENAVTILTMHRSKGLEFGVVFCPFAWENASGKETALTFHDPDSDFPLVMVMDLDPGSHPKGRFLAQKERLAENIRLLYVALTRAKQRCYLVWGKIAAARSSAMVYLFHHRTHADLNDPERLPEEILKRTFDKKDDAAFRSDLQALADKSGGSIAVSELPQGKKTRRSVSQDTPPSLSVRPFSGSIPPGWRVSSYSSLITGVSEPAEDKDEDALGQWEAPGACDYENLFTFPAGAQAGRFFHAFFESLDFSVPPVQQTALAETLLSGFGFDPSWKDAVCNAATRVLSTRLAADQGELILSRLSPRERIHEMAFDFPVKRLSPKTLAAAFDAKTKKGRGGGFSRRLGNLVFSPWEGFMRGFMDLVAFQGGRYYLIDWKSNLLGSGLEAYTGHRLSQVMEEAYYFLQYHLYVLALYRYLKLKNPSFSYERDFGGVFYLFIRGIRPDPDTGISQTGVFYDLPRKERIKTLEKTLMPDL